MEVKIAVVKEWLKDFLPSNEREEGFKKLVEEALTEVTSDFCSKKSRNLHEDVIFYAYMLALGRFSIKTVLGSGIAKYFLKLPGSFEMISEPCSTSNFKL